MEMMKAHKYNVEHRLKYDNQERILYRHHFNYYPVKRPRPRKTSLEPNWYTENIYSNQSIDNSDGELGVAAGGAAGASALRDINGNLSLNDDGIFTIDGQFERRHRYPKSSSCCFGAGARMRDIDEMGDGEAEGADGDGWRDRYPRIPKSYSFSTSRSMGAGFNVAKLYGRNSFEMPEFPSQQRRGRVRDQGALSDTEGRAVVRMCDREGCFNETCFTKDEKNLFNSTHHNHGAAAINNHSNIINNNAINSAHRSNCNLISEWNLRNRNNLRARPRDPEGVLGDGSVARPQYVMEEDFDLFDEDDDDVDEEEDDREGEEDDEDVAESELTTLYADDRHSIAYGDYGGMARQLYGPIGGQVDDLYRAERSKQLARGRLDRATRYADEFTDDYRKSFEDFFNRNCCIERHHRHHPARPDGGRLLLQKAVPGAARNKSMLEVKPPSRFDDTSSGSTDLELDDFNFDFEKYWEELEKPSPTSPSELEERKRATRGEPGSAAGVTAAGASSAGRTGGKKVKNVNLSRCYNNGTVIDIYHDDDPYHRDHYHYREGGGHQGGGGKLSNNHRQNHHHQHQHHHTTPGRSRGTSGRHKVYPSEGCFDSPRPLGEDPLGAGAVGRGGPKSNAAGSKPTALDGAGNTITSNTNAISFLNNIFSIYKPNKYSPLNCHGEQNYLKNIPPKKMNIVASSAARPLGAGSQPSSGAGGDASSTKRPLTVHPATKPSVASVASAARRSAGRPGGAGAPSSKDPQARFQIIPDKTGVKISPLYRLDAQDYRRARYKLKSTARPLSFW